MRDMGHVMSNIVLIIMPIILSAFIYNVNGYINSYMYSGSWISRVLPRT